MDELGLYEITNSNIVTETGEWAFGVSEEDAIRNFSERFPLETGRYFAFKYTGFRNEELLAKFGMAFLMDHEDMDAGYSKEQ